MARKKSKKQKHPHSYKQYKTRYPQNNPKPTADNVNARAESEIGPEEERNNRIEEKMMELCELRLDALLARVKEDPQCNISTTDMNVVTRGQKISHERCKLEHEARQAKLEAEEAENAEPEADPHAAAIGEALLKGDSAAAMQLMHKGGEWPEGVDGLQMMAMAAMADARASDYSTSPSSFSASTS